MRKVQDEVSKYIISLRFQKIQTSLKFFQEYRQREEQLGRTFKLAEYVEVHAQRVKECRILNDYELDFERSSLRPSYMPY
jgi:hypothetical protein